ncbi:eto/mtg8/nervy, putative [Ixodes scapularis]|uniref:Eto/mtg8/nervy, putative n=1 Tax=Ixodes scapularis TaxID=6945 RepID=B7QL64_IXOSC|nr:eto/mtg8/nervy, putative [Ixodes scapularis]|eukprot:XP_002415919.1 eto/mtg8/nervy, putative [Ixodes scapularis]
MNRTTPPLGAVVNATTVPLAPGGCPSNPPGLAVARSLSPPSDSNPGSSCTGVSSSTANNGTTANGPVLAAAVASPAGTSPLTSSADGAPTTGSLLLGARQLNKVKRFLTTLQQFGSDVAPDVGERVHALILGLVSSTITIEDFHQSIQEITNYPLRPFVVPFLKVRMLHRDYPEDRDMEDEWKNINTAAQGEWPLQQRLVVDPASLPTRISRLRMLHRDYPEDRDMEDEWKNINTVKEAVHEVKRQAVAELQKAVSAAESKASELVAAERTKMERLIGEARRQAAEEALAAVNHQEDSTEHCWNCGRKASETCSGCNVARYCGAFCQHKDWENHHRVCGQQPSSSPSSSSCVLAAGKRSPSPPSAARRAEAKADVARH